MILNSAPQNEAVLSNVGQIGEFRIRNSAKAFNILSSGLYANKIRAIIRELSCNAVDSHTAAGTEAMPFEVHLPTVLEPFFSIRDFGTGLTHDQVTNIYTTYFESTKTNSNAFIGALGLGSKSPFSYTDNFTVTAIKGKRKGIYTAFINDSGVPSIALMAEEDTNEAPGVEVKFSVNDRYDFDKFRNEASRVYTHFKLRPKITGVSNFTFPEIEFDTKNIIPGVHSLKKLASDKSIALMGNIAYPIDIPSSDKSLGDLAKLLQCNLLIEFGIGELDFQASREGLSYIPQTIDAIKAKLAALNAQLTVHIANEADKIENLWDRACFLYEKKHSNLWLPAVCKYVTDTKFPLIEIRGNVTSASNYNVRFKEFTVDVKDTASLYNINIRAFTKSRGSSTCSNSQPYSRSVPLTHAGQYTQVSSWKIDVDSSTFFVIKDTNVGGMERVKNHWRTATNSKNYSDSVYFLEPADSSKEMNTDAFFKSLFGPSKILKLSSLAVKPRIESDRAKNISILKLERRDAGNSRYSKRDGHEMVWRDGGKLEDFNANDTYYYAEMVGFVVQGITNYSSAKDLHNDLTNCGIKELKDVTIYGVRKADLSSIRSKKNWIPVKDYATKIVANISESSKMSLVKRQFDKNLISKYNKTIIDNIKSDSPFAEVMCKFENTEAIRYHDYCLRSIVRNFGGTLDVTALTIDIEQQIKNVLQRYPLLSAFAAFATLGNSEAEALAEYVNLIDEKKGI